MFFTVTPVFGWITLCIFCQQNGCSCRRKDPLNQRRTAIDLLLRAAAKAKAARAAAGEESEEEALMPDLPPAKCFTSMPLRTVLKVAKSVCHLFVVVGYRGLQTSLQKGTLLKLHFPKCKTGKWLARRKVLCLETWIYKLSAVDIDSRPSIL